MGITRKRLSLIPAERNSERVIEARRLYSQEMCNVSLERLVFLDETGFNLHTSQSYGYSPSNMKAFSTVKANKGVNQSLMCVIDISGVVGYEIISGAYDGEKFKHFIETKLVEYFRRNRSSILIMDNCRFHHRLDVLGLLRENLIPFKFIPVYSPQLNPIEEFFGVLKANYKAIRPRPATIGEVKLSVQGIMENENVQLREYFEKMKRFILLGMAGQPFI